MFKDNEKLKKLIDILEISNTCKFIKDNKTNDNLLKIKTFYNNNMCIYINFNELILLLKNYVGIDKILIDNIEE